jgi:CHAD domain-containing protein
VSPPPPSSRAANPTAAEVRADLEARGRVLVDAARRARRGDDADAIHDLRVAARRLGAALALARPLLRRGPRRAAQRGLRRLRRALGPLRDAEVALELLEARLTGAAVPLRRSAAPLIRRLRARVARGRARAARAALARRVARVEERVRRAVARAERRAAAHPGWPARRLAALADRARATREALSEALAHSDDAALHAARVAVKRWRYAEECASQPTAAVVVPLLRRLQETLGELRDASLLRDRLVRETLRHPGTPSERDARALLALAATLESERPAARTELRATVEELERLALREAPPATQPRRARPPVARPGRAARPAPDPARD